MGQKCNFCKNLCDCCLNLGVLQLYFVLVFSCFHCSYFSILCTGLSFAFISVVCNIILIGYGHSQTINSAIFKCSLSFRPVAITLVSFFITFSQPHPIFFGQILASIRVMYISVWAGTSEERDMQDY